MPSCFDGTLSLDDARDLDLPLGSGEIRELLSLACRVGVVSLG